MFGLFLERVKHVDGVAQLGGVHEPVGAIRIDCDDLHDVAQTTSHRLRFFGDVTDLRQVQCVPEVILSIFWEGAQIVIRRSDPDTGLGFT